MMIVVRLVRIVMVVLMVVVMVFRIERSAHHRVAVLGRPGVHVDVKSGRRHVVANGVFNP